MHYNLYFLGNSVPSAFQLNKFKLSTGTHSNKLYLPTKDRLAGIEPGKGGVVHLTPHETGPQGSQVGTRLKVFLLLIQFK